MNEKEKIKEYFKSHAICKTILSTSTPNHSLAVEAWVNVDDNSVVYTVTDNIEFCCSTYKYFNDAVDEYFAIKEKSNGVAFD